MAGSLCGVWVDDDGAVHTTVDTEGGGREDRVATLRPFAWLDATPPGETLGSGVTLEELKGEGPYNRLVHAETLKAFETFGRADKPGVGVDAIRPLESQFLLQQRERLYRELSFGQLRRCQFDI